METELCHPTAVLVLCMLIYAQRTQVEFPLVMTSWQTKHEFIFAGAVSVELLGAYSHQDLLIRCVVEGTPPHISLSSLSLASYELLSLYW